MSALAWAAVVVLGGLGSIGRFLLDGLIDLRTSGRLPLGTFVVNISGALLLGLLAGLAASGQTLVLLGVATLGSYTTFSTWMLESHRLTEDGEITWAVINVLASLLVGVGAAALGRAIGMHL